MRHELAKLGFLGTHGHHRIERELAESTHDENEL